MHKSTRACSHSIGIHSSTPLCSTRSLSALLPVAWVKSGRIEKKVISEHKKLAGTSDIDAKVLYVKAARSLPTFGVHFFLVKVGFILYFIYHHHNIHRHICTQEDQSMIILFPKSFHIIPSNV